MQDAGGIVASNPVATTQQIEPSSPKRPLMRTPLFGRSTRSSQSMISINSASSSLSLSSASSIHSRAPSLAAGAYYNRSQSPVPPMPAASLNPPPRGSFDASQRSFLEEECDTYPELQHSYTDNMPPVSASSASRKSSGSRRQYPLTPPDSYAPMPADAVYLQSSAALSDNNDYDYSPPPYMGQIPNAIDETTTPTAKPVFPPNTETIEQMNTEYQRNKQITKVIYAGEAVYNRPDSSKHALMLTKKSKKAYFVLMNTCILQFKSAAKARNCGVDLFSPKPHPTQFDKNLVLLDLEDVYGVHKVIGQPYSFRIEHLQPQTKQPLALMLTVDTADECDQWIKHLRQIVRVHHPVITTVASSERYAAMERISKQNDQLDGMVVYKAVYKEKRLKMVSQGQNTASSTSSSGSASNLNGVVSKEVFLTVLIVIGKFSFYILPQGGASTASLDDKYLKTVERDRHGLLAIQSIELDGKDDTVKLIVRQVDKPSRQIVFVSTFAENIVQYLRQAVNTLVPYPTYSLTLPQHLRDVHIEPREGIIVRRDMLAGAPNKIEDEQFDEQFLQFDIVLQAHCAALNLNKARFDYDISGPLNAKCFVLLPPTEIKETAPTYSKYELLAILRCLQACPVFRQIVLADHPLQEIESWMPQQEYGWTISLHTRQKDASQPNIGNNSVLAVELYDLVLSSRTLRTLDLTNCQLGHSPSVKVASALSAVALALQGTPESPSPKLDCIYVGKNKMAYGDHQAFVTSLHVKKTVKEFDVHDCNLQSQQIEQLLSSILSHRPDRLEYLDISSDKPITISSGLVESLFERCNNLKVFRMRGHVPVVLSMLLKDSHPAALRELDLSHSKIPDITPLCRWMQRRCFNSVEVLRVDHCGLHGGHLRDLLMAITQSGNRRVHLGAGGNPISRDVVHLPKLFPAFMQGEGPCSLSLAETEWEDSMLREFFDCLRDNQILVKLDLSDMLLVSATELSVETVRMLASMLERNTVLKELNLSCKNPKSAGQRQTVDISKGISQALEGLKRNVSLERIGLAGLKMGDTGANILASVLQKNRTLLAIDIDDNEITIEGFRALASAIQSGSTIIDMPKPRKDLRHQLSKLKQTIAGLVQSENETKWFIIHSTSISDTRRVKTQLQMQTQARQSAELSYKHITDVVTNMMNAVHANRKAYEARQQRTQALQMQAQAAAQELAVAQLRLQSSNSIAASSVRSGLGGANLSAVGGVRSTYNRSPSAYSTGSSNSSSDSSEFIRRQYRNVVPLYNRVSRAESISTAPSAASYRSQATYEMIINSPRAPPPLSSPPPSSPPPPPPPAGPSRSAESLKPFADDQLTPDTSMVGSPRTPLSDDPFYYGGISPAHFQRSLSLGTAMSQQRGNHQTPNEVDPAMLGKHPRQRTNTTPSLSPPSSAATAAADYGNPAFIDDFGIVVTHNARLPPSVGSSRISHHPVEEHDDEDIMWDGHDIYTQLQAHDLRRWLPPDERDH